MRGIHEQRTTNNQQPSFILLAGICTFGTVITNLLIHFITFPQGTFEENVQLYKNAAYIWFNWTILFHCLMVLISMLGFAIVLDRYSRLLAILGFLMIFVFVITEWQRTLNVLWYLNGLRARYDVATDENLKQWLRFELQHDSYQSNVQFLLFAATFSLGNFFNGLCLVFQDKWNRWLGAGLLLWSVFTALPFVLDFYPTESLDVIVAFSNKYYQPLMRCAIGVWLVDVWRRGGEDR